MKENCWENKMKLMHQMYEANYISVQFPSYNYYLNLIIPVLYIVHNFSS